MMGELNEDERERISCGFVACKVPKENIAYRAHILCHVSLNRREEPYRRVHSC